MVLLPYDSTDQVTSGVLIEAVAAGKPVVATRFPHAVELLGDGAGIVVPHPGSDCDRRGTADRLLTRPEVAVAMSRAPPRPQHRPCGGRPSAAAVPRTGKIRLIALAEVAA